MKIIKNFIQDKEIFNNIKDTLMGCEFPYYYFDCISGDNDKTDYFFGHTLFAGNGSKSDFFNTICTPLLDRIEFTYLLRAKVNFYTKKPKPIKTGMHVDFSQKHKVALFSVNTNNGYTLFENGEKIKSIENQLVIFDGALKHCSVAQTDTNVRVNINLNIV